MFFVAHALKVSDCLFAYTTKSVALLDSLTHSKSFNHRGLVVCIHLQGLVKNAKRASCIVCLVVFEEICWEMLSAARVPRGDTDVVLGVFLSPAVLAEAEERELGGVGENGHTASGDGVEDGVARNVGRT